MGDRVGNLLVIVVDLHPVWWANHSLTEVIQSSLILANAHLLQSPLNKLSVYGYMNTGVYKLYPDEENLVVGESTAGKFEGFDVVNTTILMKIKDVMLECDNPEEHRQLDGSPDSRSQYMAIMNSIFAAQKNKVSIDSCVLGEDSTFLQQASEITGGTYVRVGEHSKLTQYLLGVFLMGVEFRKSFHTPPAAKVDFRAACQCHSKMTDVGYVCSVCMSVYCNFRPMCMTCNAHFKLPTALLKGKKVTGKRKLENGKS
ncbi:general transcription factor IIH subunit 3-like isoform X2 [Bolinopsis microptera]|uniref:general transcription factor IIH subunit 3-like isoform X2 n=1 Tax=Bolinopsis microptera TaxID=2820187 RepID=UPI00307AAD18